MKTIYAERNWKMIRQISVDIEIPNDKYDKFDNEEMARVIEENFDGVLVLGVDTTRVWKDEEYQQ